MKKSLLAPLLALSLLGALTAPTQAATPLQAFSPELQNKVLHKRSILAQSELGPADASKRRTYSLFVGEVINAPLATVRKTLTQYSLYAKLVPFITMSNHIPGTDILFLQGGIWKFVTRSQVRIQTASATQINFEFFAGHFEGLKARMRFFALNASQTLVWIDGSLTDTRWPPAWIIEAGGKAIFVETAKRMREAAEKR